MPPPTRASRLVRRVGALAILGLVTSACQLRLATDIDVRADGSGTLELAVATDQELRSVLDAGGVDLRTGLDEVATAAPSWDVESSEPDDGGLELRFRTSFDDPDELSRLVEELRAGLDDEDGELLRDVVLTVDEEGAVEITGVAGVVLPATTGAVGPEVAFDGDDLRGLLAERGDELVRADLRITLPASPSATDADAVDGRELTWQLPIGEMRAFSARSRPPSQPAALVLAAVAVVSAILAAGLVLWLRRRRRSRVAP